MKILTSLFLILLSALVAFGQVEKNKSDKKIKPNFSGIWILDRTKTKRVDYDLTLVVVHQEPEMKITGNFDSNGVKRTEEQLYYTDSRKTAKVRKDYFEFSYETKWAGKNIIHKIIESNIGGSDQRLKTEEWELSEDGGALTISIVEGFYFGRDQSNTPIGNIRNNGSVKVLKFNRSKDN